MLYSNLSPAAWSFSKSKELAMTIAGGKHPLCRLFCCFLLIACLAGCQDTKAWLPGKPLDKDSIKIGILFVDAAASVGYSYAHDLGIRKTQRALGLRDDQILRKINVSGAEVGKVEHAMSEAIAEGANIIIATSWGHMDTCEKLASQYPNVIFANASGYKSNDTNFTNYYGRIHQARYLSGLAAGLQTKTGKIGFVAAQDKSNSEVTGGLNAFAMGVESVNPGAKVYVIVTYSWSDPAGERMAAQKLINAGCDVLAQHSDTPQPQIAAEKAGVWGIGYNADMSREAPDAVLTSVIWNWDTYYTFLINSVIDGSFTTKPYFGDLASGMVDISPLNSALATPEMEAAVAEARERILSGKFNVFGGVMETNDGRKIGAVGGVLSDSEISTSIDWYYRNIIEMK